MSCCATSGRRAPRSLTKLPHGPSQERLARVREVIKRMGLAKVAHTRVGTDMERGLSGGERKRLNVAQELLTDPAVLLADGKTPCSRPARRTQAWRRSLYSNALATHPPQGNRSSLAVGQLPLFHTQSRRLVWTTWRPCRSLTCLPNSQQLAAPSLLPSTSPARGCFVGSQHAACLLKAGWCTAGLRRRFRRTWSLHRSNVRALRTTTLPTMCLRWFSQWIPRTWKLRGKPHRHAAAARRWLGEPKLPPCSRQVAGREPPLGASCRRLAPLPWQVARNLPQAKVKLLPGPPPPRGEPLGQRLQPAARAVLRVAWMSWRQRRLTEARRPQTLCREGGAFRWRRRQHAKQRPHSRAWCQPAPSRQPASGRAGATRAGRRAGASSFVL